MRRGSARAPWFVVGLFGLSCVGLAYADSRPAARRPAIDPAVLERLEWRNIGPANMGGRTTDIEGVPGVPSVVYVAAAAGGVWKTTNAGGSWKPLFDKQKVASIGDIALEPGNPEVVYVGTGEANVRNSVSSGNGVYKSTDGGQSWKYLGLEDTRHISRIVVSPREPNKVYVGALGHAFGPNKERGVYMSVNGGETWDKVLYLDEHHGVADLDIDPQNPNVLYAAMWRFERKPWTFTSGSEQGGVFRSVDGGRTWSKLDKGLPKLMGRIAVKVAPSNPRVVYVLAESNEGTLFRSDDRGETFMQVSKDANIVNRGFYYTDLRIDPTSEDRLVAVASQLQASVDGGKTFKRIARGVHVDFHALWIDPKDPDRMWVGDDGGLAVSYDRGQNWDYVNNIPIGQFYQLYADDRQPFYHLGGGLQDNGTWSGPSRTREPSGIHNDDWRMVSFGDGFHIVSHPDDPDVFLSESQGGNIRRTNMRTREVVDVSPQPRRNDGGPVSGLKYRFNWNAPIVASPHDGKTVYFGANVVFKTTDFGGHWQAISPDLTTNDPDKQGSAGGPVWHENTTAEYHCTIISLAESPADAAVLWAGTDDGNLQVSRDGGKSWTNVVGSVPGLGRFSPVSHVELSRTAAGTAYAAFDRHLLDDPKPYVYKTTDFGHTWTSLSADLPEKAYVFVLREDPRNPGLLYAGTELGLYALYPGAATWTRLHLKNLPTVPVHDILVHPKANDLILATHGRAIWIFDDASPLQQLGADALGKSAYLFDVREPVRFATKPTRYGIGDRIFRGPNPPYGALITYHLKSKPDKDTPIKVEVLSEDGKLLRELKKVPAEAGLNRVAWDLNSEPPRERKERTEGEEDEDFGGPPRGPRVLPGRYRIRLTVGKEMQEKPVEVRFDPTVSASSADLEQQFAVASRLTALRSEVNDALRGLDALRQQLEDRRKLAEGRGKEGASDLPKQLKAKRDQVEAAASRLARPEGRPTWSEPVRVSERLQALFASIDSANGAPTAPQLEYLTELEQEAKKAMADVSQEAASLVTEVNGVLTAHRIPPVASLRAEETAP
jgi:photosystem II stability/assembly factor-like uncharacterized protein